VSFASPFALLRTLLAFLLEQNHLSTFSISIAGSGSIFTTSSIDKHYFLSRKAVLFFTAGELVAAQIPGYVPYADKNGLWVRAWPSPDRSLIEKDWKPHQNGSMELQQALSKLADDLASASPHP
jgi:hypothetical protein